MSSKIRNVALLLPALVLATGLASAQTIQVTSTNSDGSTATTTLDSSNGAPAANAPATGRFWDGLSSTDYYNRAPYIAAPPNPQIAVGPDDILTIVNRTIARYPNPNAGGAGNGTTVPNPYLNPPTDQVWLDTWLGLTNLGLNIGGNGQATGTVAGSNALCPSGTSNNATCVIDNASIRYDQLQGRFVVVFTVTDMPAHRSNIVVIVSKSSQFDTCRSTTPVPPTCQTLTPAGASSPLFTPPVIAPIVGGTQTGGQNPNNWFLYKFPINLAYRNDNAGATTEVALGFGKVSTPNIITTGGNAAVNFLTTPFCPNGGPTVGPNGIPTTTPVIRSCTNYFPTGLRMGFDNDNLILVAPVLDMAFSGVSTQVAANTLIPNAPGVIQLGTADGVPEGTLATSSGLRQGVFAGTRVLTVAKMMIYNQTPPSDGSSISQPAATGSCLQATPISCSAVNLADNVVTGTVTTLGSANGNEAGNGGLQGCAVKDGIFPQVGANLASQCSNIGLAALGPIVPPIFFEPDNLRGRALASFDAQVAGPFNLSSGVIAPFTYLVGTRIGIGPVNNGVINDGSTGVQYFLQPIVFSCPGTAGAIFPGVAGVAFCGTTSAGQVADLPVLGILRGKTYSQLNVTDPLPVGQGFSSSQLTTNPSNNPVTGTYNSRLFVGDSRPQQVIFREGLLYVARTVRTYDTNVGGGATPVNAALNTSTVLYELIKTCASSGVSTSNGNTIPNCGATFSPVGGNITGATSAMSGIWTYSTNVPDGVNGNPAGFGFYQPMFDVPADVVNSFTGGPTPPTNTFPWLENVFVGMTTGGTSNVAATFSKNYPSLWDFRPGDDAYDTPLPYLDPATGIVRTSVTCPGDAAIFATITKGSANVLVSDATGLQVGMYLTTGGITGSNPTQITAIVKDPVTGISTVTLSSSVTANSASGVQLAFSLNAPSVTFTINNIVNGSNQITVNSATGLQIGQVFGSSSTTKKSPAFIQSATTVAIPNNTGVGVGMVLTGDSNSYTATTAIGSNIIVVPSTALVVSGQVVTGPAGILPAATAVATSGALPAGCPVANFPTGSPVALNPQDATGTTLLVCLNNAATGGGSNSLKFDNAGLFASNVVTGVTVNGSGQAVVTISPALTAAVVAGALGTTVPAPAGNGISVIFTANYNGQTNSFFPAAPTITNISGTTITVSPAAAFNQAAVAAFPTCPTPLPGGGFGPNAPCSGNLPASVQGAATAGPAAVCPMIPFSQRGGAATDPNDGSLWLYGEFAKNRLATIPGPGQWGTAVANYPLTFPALDTYGNDNTYFADVPPTGSANSIYFTWVQIAKNVGLAQPATTGPCPTNPAGTQPIPQPPDPGTTPTPGTGQLICPFFGPDTDVTRAEMAYWVVRSQMDETMISNYLCATGGDPSGIATCTGVSGGQTAQTFADTTGLKSPFVTVPTLGFPGISANQMLRYIEVMARRGYTKGCGSTNDPLSRYCPSDLVKRQEMAVFLIRAKMNNVFPTQLSGLPSSSIYGDNFGSFQSSGQYFADVPNTGATADYYKYIQKMRELRITNGTSGSTFSPTQTLKRKEIVTFVVRAFFL